LTQLLPSIRREMRPLKGRFEVVPYLGTNCSHPLAKIKIEKIEKKYYV